MFITREGLGRDHIRVFWPLLLFVSYSLFILFVASGYFDGAIRVQASRDGLGTTGTPFHFRFENYAQHLYVITNGIGALCIAHRVSRMPGDEVARLIRQAVLGFIFLAGGVTLWELVHFMTGIYFPAQELFHNNVGYSLSSGQTFSHGYRLSGPFAEPSALGYYFAGCLLFAFRLYELERSLTALLALMASAIFMLMSTSTAAYFFVGIFIAGLCVMKLRVIGVAIGSAIIHGIGGRKINPTHLAIVLVSVALAAVLLVRYSTVVGSVIDEFILAKKQGESFSHRAGADSMAFDVLIDSYGLGLGLGSHKANNLPMTILSNTGVAGLLAFVGFIVNCYRYGAQRRRREPMAWRAISPLQWFVTGLVIQHGFMNPNLNSLVFWVAIGLLIGGGSCSGEARSEGAAAVAARDRPDAEAHAALVR
jgi:hypothetical protein